MKTGRFSIAKVMAVTAILAIDLAWLRVITRGYGTIFGIVEAIDLANGFLFEFGLLGMFNALALGLLGLASVDHDRRDFLIGFEAFGLVAMLAYWGCCSRWGAWLLPEPRYLHGRGLFRVGETVVDVLLRIGLGPKSVGHAVFLVYTVILTLPQLIVAVLGGILFRLAANRSDKAAD